VSNAVHPLVTYGFIQREIGQEKFDIALQKLDEDDAAEDLLLRLEEQSLAHYNYSKVMVEFCIHSSIHCIGREGCSGFRFSKYGQNRMWSRISAGIYSRN